MCAYIYIYTYIYIYIYIHTYIHTYIHICNRLNAGFFDESEQYTDDEVAGYTLTLTMVIVTRTRIRISLFAVVRSSNYTTAM